MELKNTLKPFKRGVSTDLPGNKHNLNPGIKQNQNPLNDLLYACEKLCMQSKIANKNKNIK